ncbi:Mitogen-activated protein kinase kinase kinase 17 [Camellia lanceoleosa]|uniref:Mitogen-activated protein kinase kinase kinase 17 n=1 Tax=Camellia lanceoleosa TaxID=1840588 RepID=A0ACC0FEP8_9ERIC|nr:Mitogen-activated protein kinase kinase kinase 17 [Camellia lanceoleosa]
MVLIKRKHDELEIKKSVYGDEKLWFKGPIIGKSSSGPVYLATLKKPTWRLTHLPILMVVKSTEVSDSAMLQREAMVLNNFYACPYIYCCFGKEIMTDYYNRIIYNILLEYGSDGTLADLIKKSGGRVLLESDVRCYTRHIIEGLNCVHSSGYVHRALKLENIIVVSISTSTRTEYVAKVGDFRLAKIEKQMKKMMTMSKSYKLRGNIRCLSPEMVVDRGLQQETPYDVWDVGCIVFEMLTGKSVWDGKQDSEVEDILSDIGKGHGLLKLPNESEDSEDNEEELSVENSEEKGWSTSTLSLSDYKVDDELSSSYFPDERELKVKKLKLHAEAIRVCSSLTYKDSAVKDEISSSYLSDDWSNMPLVAEELQDIVEPGRVDWSLSLSVQY